MTGSQLHTIVTAASAMSPEQKDLMLRDTPNLPQLLRRLRRLVNLAGQVLKVGRLERTCPRFRSKREAAIWLYDHLLLLDELSTASTLEVLTLARSSIRRDQGPPKPCPN